MATDSSRFVGRDFHKKGVAKGLGDLEDSLSFRAIEEFISESQPVLQDLAFFRLRGVIAR
jgi:hypothetical protein